MLVSVKLQRRQSEIREALAELLGKESLTEDETRKMAELDVEYRANEVKYRAALIAEDTERREAGADLDTRQDRQRAELIRQFEMRQIALCLDEGRALTGATLEIVTELRSQGSYSGLPIPWAALELRAGETVASGTPDPTETRPVIDRLFPASVSARMGASLIAIDHGTVEWPVTTSAVTAAWQASETGAVGGPTPFTTLNKPLAPDHTLGIQMKITRKTLKQSGGALEDAVRRDMNSAIAAGLDRAVFLGTGAVGDPLGVLVGSYGITSTPLAGPATWAAFRAAVVAFLVGNAASSPGDARLLIRPEVYDTLDDTVFDAGSGVTEWDRLVKNIPASNISMSSNALDAPSGGPPAVSEALLTTSVGGVAPIFVGAWGGIDLIRDPYSDAASGGLRLTGLATMDVTVSRPAQLQIITGIQ